MDLVSIYDSYGVSRRFGNETRTVYDENIRTSWSEVRDPNEVDVVLRKRHCWLITRQIAPSSWRPNVDPCLRAAIRTRLRTHVKEEHLPGRKSIYPFPKGARSEARQIIIIFVNVEQSALKHEKNKTYRRRWYHDPAQLYSSLRRASCRCPCSSLPAYSRTWLSRRRCTRRGGRTRQH